MNRFLLLVCVATSMGSGLAASASSGASPPNIVVMLADDLGYGDPSCYGGTRLRTPNLDRLADHGLRFTDAHSAAASCTPSRYALLTGEYAFRKKGTGILPGDASLIIQPGRTTLASMLKTAGCTTGVVGKWHLGLSDCRPDWNSEIKPGPLEIGFDYCFIIPATGDRVPCVYVENHRVVGLDPGDPIQINYAEPVGHEPTGKEHPELLKMHPSHGHDFTIVNGISRIGYMSGGKAARWVDEDMADTITKKAVGFIEKHAAAPFFLYFATHDIHVPRVPHPRFAGESGLGPRGDAVLEFDWSVGQIIETLDRLKIAENTLLIVSSDNGPVIDDGYKDEAVEKLDGHKPSGPWRGGKGSLFEAGTRVPFIVRWPARVKPGVSTALVCQVDLLASFAAITGQKLSDTAAPDSFDVSAALVGESKTGRHQLIEHAGATALRSDNWKYIPVTQGPRKSQFTNTELGSEGSAQMYDLDKDPGERRNLASDEPGKAKELESLLEKLRQTPRTRP